MTSTITTADIEHELREMIRSDETILTAMGEQDRAESQAAHESKLVRHYRYWQVHTWDGVACVYHGSDEMTWHQAKRLLAQWRKARVVELLAGEVAP